MLPAPLAAGLALALPAAAQVAPPRSSSEAVAQTKPRSSSAAMAQTIPRSSSEAIAQPKPPAPSPGEIVAAAPASDWVAIAPADLLVMTLGPDRDPGSEAGAGGAKRQVTIQLMPPPFSQGWIGNIRKLAAAHWWDGLAITRVQDNYVVQWGDPDGEDKAKARKLPDDLQATSEAGYKAARFRALMSWTQAQREENADRVTAAATSDYEASLKRLYDGSRGDAYAPDTGWLDGWPVAADRETMWPVHCYGTVGVGRYLSPDTGSGAELYTVIGHAPRHLDRNIALVGRVVEGIEHLSSLPRGTGSLGFYEKAEQRVPIASIRLATELPAAEQPRFEYLSTESDSFAQYADARANRRDPFFIVPAGGADICNIPVPVRRAR